MRAWLLFFGLLLLPSIALAADEPVSPYRWTVGYEYGVTLRRFIGRDWEIFLGGGFNNTKEGAAPVSVWGSSKLPDQPLTTWDWQDAEFYKYSSISITLGAGKTVMRDGRFWLNGTLRMRYHGSGRHKRNVMTFDHSTNFSVMESHHHYRGISCSLGLRPAFDLTKRITAVMNFGLYFRLSDNIQDQHTFRFSDHDENGVLELESHIHRRSAYRNTSDYSFGSVGFDSITFIFRF